MIKMNENRKIITEEQAFARMARTCSQKECCRFDVRKKLSGMNLSEQAVEKIIEMLIAGKFIDDKRFIRSFINDKLHFNKWGRIKIEASLRQKHVPKGLIDEVFSEFSSSDLNEPLQPLLEKKIKTITAGSEYERNGKLIRYALGRGFPISEILLCMKRMNLDNIPD